MFVHTRLEKSSALIPGKIMSSICSAACGLQAHHRGLSPASVIGEQRGRGRAGHADGEPGAGPPSLLHSQSGPTWGSRDPLAFTLPVGTHGGKPQSGNPGEASWGLQPQARFPVSRRRGGRAPAGLRKGSHQCHGLGVFPSASLRSSFPNKSPILLLLWRRQTGGHRLPRTAPCRPEVCYYADSPSFSSPDKIIDLTFPPSDKYPLEYQTPFS